MSSGTYTFFKLYLESFYKNIILFNYKDKSLILSYFIQEYSVVKINSKNLIHFEKDNINLNTIKNFILEIKKDKDNVKLNNYKCVSMTIPNNLNTSFLSDYYLHYDYDNSDLFDTYSELELKELFKSNLNSAFVKNYLKL